MAKSLFEKYGGFAEVRKIVSDFYDEVLDDELLAHHFRGVNMRRLIDHQTKMISSVLGGPAHIADEQLARAHRRLQIKAVEFDRLLDIMSNTLEDHDFDADDRQAVLNRIGNTRPFIVGD